MASSSRPLAMRYFGDSCRVKITYRQRNMTKVKAPLLRMNFCSNAVYDELLTACSCKVSEAAPMVENRPYNVKRHPLLSASRHWPAGNVGSQEKFAMNAHAMSEATSWPKDHHADNRVSVHCTYISAVRGQVTTLIPGETEG